MKSALSKAVAVFAISIALFGLSACSDSDDKSSSGTSTAGAIDVSMKDFSFTGKDLTATAGKVTFKVKNDGQAPHNFKIRDAGGTVVGGSKTLSPGQSEDVSVDLKAGDYTTFCGVSGHESLGMKGTLKVS